jgi:hypothetical protein
LPQVQVLNGVPPTEDYSLAKYNKVNVDSVLNHLFYIYAGEIKKTSQRTGSSMNWPKGAKAEEVAKIMDLRIA